MRTALLEKSTQPKKNVIEFELMNAKRRIEDLQLQPRKALGYTAMNFYRPNQSIGSINDFSTPRKTA